MTAQVGDTVIHEREEWELAGVRGAGLFDPAAGGITVRPTNTACYRGFVCTYKTLGDAFVLDRLELSADGPSPPLFGCAPVLPGDPFGFTASYLNLNHHVPFTGGILIARDFVQELYVHMGFHPAWKYERVIELQIDAGRILSIDDRSAAIRDIRERLREEPLGPGSPDGPNELTRWIARTFSREY